MDILAAASWYIKTYPTAAIGGGPGWPCSVFTANVALRASNLTNDPVFKRGGDWWQMANIWRGQDKMSPVPAYRHLAAVYQGRLTQDDIPAKRNVTAEEAVLFMQDTGPGWYLVQGWKDSGKGHQFFVRFVDYTEAADILECSEELGVRMNGVRWDGSPQYVLGVHVMNKLEDYATLGVVLLEGDDPEQPQRMEAYVAEEDENEEKLLTIPSEVSEAILQEVKDAAKEALQTALAELAAASTDGRLDPEDAGVIVAAVVDEVLDSVVAIADALLPLPEPFESLQDLAFEKAADFLREESGPLEDLVDAVKDALDGPERDDIERKLAKHAYRFRVQGKKASQRKMRKHAHRLLKHFPGAAARLGIRGELGDRKGLFLGFRVVIPEGADQPVVLPPVGE